MANTGFDVLRDSGAVQATGPAGTAPRNEPTTLSWAARTALALLATTLIWWPLCAWRLGAAPFYTKGEPREGLVVWEMTHGGGWILPRRNGTEIPSKPPMFHWLGALAAQFGGGVSEGTLRLPSALAALLGLYAVVLAGSAWWSVRAGFFAGLVLATSFEWTRAATNARVDMVLTLGLEVAFLGLLFFWCQRMRSALWALYGGMAWAVLAKGPVGVALPGLAGAVLLASSWNGDAWRERRWMEVLRWDVVRQLRLGRGLPFVFLVAGAWYGLALWEGGWDFFRKQILAENIFTFLDDPDWGGGHRHGLLYLPVQWFLGSLPWSVVWPLVGAALWRLRRDISRNDPLLGLIVWVVVVFVFYEFAASKRGVYLLALYPAVALLCGWWWSEVAASQTGEGSTRWRLTVGYLATAVGAVLLLALIVAGLLAVGWRYDSDWPYRLAGEAGMLAAGAAGDVFRHWPAVVSCFACAASWWWAGRVLRKDDWLHALAWVFVAAWVSSVAGRVWLLPAYAQQVTLRPFMAAVRSATEGSKVYFWRTFDYQAVYYFYGRIPALGAEEIPSDPAFLLVDRRTWDDREGDLERWYEEVRLELRDRKIPSRLVLLRRKPV
ncbi:MAG: hypothetical protein KatS3mg077_3396 [Candidatus Binatia bacterium]|nr:MAG: hypothetical protein KatS3mg077_3396 [Candidatus Binatia bacterium]